MPRVDDSINAIQSAVLTVNITRIVALQNKAHRGESFGSDMGTSLDEILTAID